MSGGEAEARAKSDNVVVGIGGSGCGGYVDGVPGGISDGGGGRDGQDRNCNGQLIKSGGFCGKHNLTDIA